MNLGKNQAFQLFFKKQKLAIKFKVSLYNAFSSLTPITVTSESP